MAPRQLCLGFDLLALSTVLFNWAMTSDISAPSYEQAGKAIILHLCS